MLAPTLRGGEKLPRARALLTAEGRRRHFALVHTVDGAEGAHDVARAEAVQHLARLDERFAVPAARQFAVCLRQGGKANHTVNNNNAAGC